MLDSVHALLTGLIDYAGLFPPAKLPLDQALRHYADYRRGPDAWMLGRFIVPAARLAEVSEVGGPLLASGPPWAFSALGRGGAGMAEFLEGLSADLQAIQDFRRRHGARVVVDVYEVKLPGDLRAASGFYASVADQLETSGHGALRVFYEPSFGPHWRETWPALAAGMGGLKLRCGGLEPAAFPTPEQVAFALDLCRRTGLAFKATAGLHHPVRRRDAGLNVMMHGFLNVFGGAVLAAEHALGEGQIRAVIEDEDARHFAFDDAGFAWRDLRVTAEQVEAHRQTLGVSFGSCSFDEPREDLRALGLL